MIHSPNHMGHKIKSLSFPMEGGIAEISMELESSIEIKRPSGTLRASWEPKAEGTMAPFLFSAEHLARPELVGFNVFHQMVCTACFRDVGALTYVSFERAGGPGFSLQKVVDEGLKAIGMEYPECECGNRLKTDA